MVITYLKKERKAMHELEEHKLSTKINSEKY